MNFKLHQHLFFLDLCRGTHALAEMTFSTESSVANVTEILVSKFLRES